MSRGVTLSSCLWCVVRGPSTRTWCLVAAWAPGASFVTGFTVTGFTVEGGSLLRYGRPMMTVPLHDALAGFLAFLRGFHSPVLVTHNVLRFDAPILLRALKGFSLQNELGRVIPGFLDTLLLSKDLPACSGVRRFSLQYLVEYFLGKSFEAHDTLEDSKALEQLCHVWHPSPMLMRRHLYTVQQIQF